jgi:hypothetical protein
LMGLAISSKILRVVVGTLAQASLLFLFLAELS